MWKEMTPHEDINILNKDGSLYYQFKKNETNMLWIKRGDKLWRRFRNMILKEYGNNCIECNTLGDKYNPINIHHIIPVNVDTNYCYDINNCVPLCKKCHKELHWNNSHKKLVEDREREKFELMYNG